MGFVNFTKVIFRLIKPLKLIGSWFPERSAYLGSLCSLGVSPLQYFALFALMQSRVDLMSILSRAISARTLKMAAPFYDRI